jgi:protein-S-isoprenylcysteine O-methyltransferase Ste14
MFITHGSMMPQKSKKRAELFTIGGWIFTTLLAKLSMAVNITELVIRLILTAVVFGVMLFLPAGTVAWPTAWVYLVLLFSFTIGISVWLSRFNPDLLSERMSGIGKSGHKRWDKLFLSLLVPLFFGWYVVMAFDMRFHWSPIPDWLQWIGAGVLLASFYIFYLTFRENTYLSPAVRIQTDRGQTVVSTGPYKYVRHPMYAGFILFTVGTALLLGSACGLIGALVLNALITWRAVREEQVLKNELPGYSEYMTRVKYRFVPYLL